MDTEKTNQPQLPADQQPKVDIKNKLISEMQTKAETHIKKLSESLKKETTEARWAGIFRALQGLNEIEYNDIDNPLVLLNQLIELSCGDDAEWQYSWLKREIVHYALMYTYLALIKCRSDDQLSLRTKTWNGLLEKVNQERLAILKRPNSSSTQLFQLDLIHVVLKVLLNPEKIKKFKGQVTELLKHGLDGTILGVSNSTSTMVKATATEAVNIANVITILTLGVGGIRFFSPASKDFSGVKKEIEHIKAISRIIFDLSRQAKSQLDVNWYVDSMLMYQIATLASESIHDLKELQRLLKNKDKSNWHIVFAGVEALCIVISSTNDQTIQHQALEGDANFPGLLSYLSYTREKKTSKLKLWQTGKERKHVWRVRQIAAECCIRLSLNKKNHEIKEKALEALKKRYTAEQDERVKNTLFKYDEILLVEQSMQSDWGEEKTATEDSIEKCTEKVKDEIIKEMRTISLFEQSSIETRIEDQTQGIKELAEAIQNSNTDKETIKKLSNELETQTQCLNLMILNFKKIRRDLGKDISFLIEIEKQTNDLIETSIKIAMENQEIMKSEFTRLNEKLDQIKKFIQALKEQKLSTTHDNITLHLVDDIDVLLTQNKFVDIQDEQGSYIEQLHFRLENGRAMNAISQAIKGMGGLGKTRLAAEYVKKYHDEYDLVIWIDTDLGEEMTRSQKRFNKITEKYRMVFDELNETLARRGDDLLPISDNDKKVRSLFIREIPRRFKKSLIVFDNAEKYSEINPYLPKSFSGHTSHILFTSRSDDWPDDMKFDISIMSVEQGTELLKVNTKRLLLNQDEINACGEITRAVDGLALALTHIASYIVENELCSFRAYVNDMQTRSPTLFDGSVDESNRYAHAVSTTWSITINKLMLEHQDLCIKKIMQYVSYLAPDKIPLDFLKKDENIDHTNLNTTLKLLSSYNLINYKRHYKTISVHRMVQQAQFDQLNIDEKLVLIKQLNSMFRRYDFSDSRDAKVLGRTAKIIPHFLSFLEKADKDNEFLNLDSAYHLTRVKNLLDSFWFLMRKGSEAADLQDILDYVDDSLEKVSKNDQKKFSEAETYCLKIWMIMSYGTIISGDLNIVREYAANSLRLLQDLPETVKRISLEVLTKYCHAACYSEKLYDQNVVVVDDLDTALDIMQSLRVDVEKDIDVMKAFRTDCLHQYTQVYNVTAQLLLRKATYLKKIEQLDFNQVLDNFFYFNQLAIGYFKRVENNCYLPQAYYEQGLGFFLKEDKSKALKLFGKAKTCEKRLLDNVQRFKKIEDLDEKIMSCK